MDLFAARELARNLMRQHGLQGWTFRFDHARRRFGSCQFKRRVITLSKPLTFLNSQEQVRDTILHEIAHALTPGDGHGRRWKERCVELGARPLRCYGDQEVVSPPRRPARYRMGCAACDWWVDRHRLGRRKLVCRQCRVGVVFRPKNGPCRLDNPAVADKLLDSSRDGPLAIAQSSILDIEGKSQ